MKKNLLFTLVYLVLLTICIGGYSASRYQVSSCGTDIARVAKPIITIVPVSATFNKTVLTDDQIAGGINLTNLQPGDTLVYDFQVCNYDNSLNINEVLLRYSVNAVLSSTDLPLSATLKASGADYNNEWVTMGYGTQVADSYELTVVWDPAKTDATIYADKSVNVQIKVNVQQLEG